MHAKRYRSVDNSVIKLLLNDQVKIENCSCDTFHVGVKTVFKTTFTLSAALMLIVFSCCF